ncbi:MAG TPA: DMT family transporter [Sphaerochaeta sp.]|nr:DMT family transporter [Sphaerochaeta sp.]
MQQALYLFLDFLTGMVISIMVVANTQLGVEVTMGVSLIVNHIIGLVFLTLLLWVGKNNRNINAPRKRAPLYLWFNGVFGLAILNLNYYSIINTGASLAMASTVFGQSFFSVVFDLTGFMGMKKRKLSPKKMASLGISAVGIVIMALGGEGDFIFGFILLGFLAGALTMTQMVLNSTFASYKGSIFASRHNFLTGLVAGLLFYFITVPKATVSGFQALPSVSPLLIFSGGLLAIFVVVSTSYVIIKVPAIYSALLLSAAQILMSLAIDTLFFDAFSLNLLIGASLMLVGMGGNLLVDKKKATPL